MHSWYVKTRLDKDAKDVSMPFKTGLGTAGDMNKGFEDQMKTVSMPFKTGLGTAGMPGRIVTPPNRHVSMPFKTGLGTAGCTDSQLKGIETSSFNAL